MHDDMEPDWVRLGAEWLEKQLFRSDTAAWAKKVTENMPERSPLSRLYDAMNRNHKGSDEAFAPFPWRDPAEERVVRSGAMRGIFYGGIMGCLRPAYRVPGIDPSKLYATARVQFTKTCQPVLILN